MSARWAERSAYFLAVLVLAIAAWRFVPLAGGYFVSDDFVPLVLFDQWEREGRFWEALFGKFGAALDAGENRFYRPLSYFTLGLNYAAGGADPAHWLWVNVATHLASGVLVGVLALQLLCRRDALAVQSAAIGAACFLFATPAAEVMPWASGRFDGLATFFTVLACVGFAASRRATDAAGLLSLLAAAAAMLSKESAAVVPFAILFLALWRVHRDEPAALRMALLMRALRQAAPWIALAGLYLMLRFVLFGNALRVYGGTTPFASIASLAYWNEVVTGFPPWLALQFPFAPMRWAIYAVTVGQVLLMAVGFSRVREGRFAFLAAVASLAVTVLLLLPHIGRMPEDGIGGRLFYQTAVFYGLAVAIALAVLPSRVLLAFSMVLVFYHFNAQNRMLEGWEAAHRDLRALAPALERLHARLKPGEYAVVFAPPGREGIPFAQNAQAGFILPPVQPRVLTDRVLLQVHEEARDLPGKLQQDLIPTLQRHSVFEWAKGTRVKGAGVVYPTHLYCWSSSYGTLEPLPLVKPADPAAWGTAVAAALELGWCDRRDQRLRSSGG